MLFDCINHFHNVNKNMTSGCKYEVSNRNGNYLLDVYDSSSSVVVAASLMHSVGLFL